MRRASRGIAAAWMFLALFAALGFQAADAASLTAVHLDVTAARISRIVAGFISGVPLYKVSGNATTDVSVVLLGTTVAPSLSQAHFAPGLLKSISVDRKGENLRIVLHATERANITVAPGPGQTLILTLASVVPMSSFATSTALPTQAAPSAPAATDTVEMVRLKYADISEVAGLLVPGAQITSNDSFTPQEQQFGSSNFNGASAFGGGSLAMIGSQPLATAQQTQAGASLAQQLNDNVGVDRRLNAIFLSGPSDVVARYKAKIAMLDVPLASVDLEVQIVELDDSAAKDLGIDFTNTGGPIASATLGVKSLTSGQAAANFQAAIYAQIQNGFGRSIARPHVTALEGTTAQIITGTQIPIVTSIAVSGVSAVSSQVQYINVGVSLEIQSRINQDGYVTSHIFSQVSSQTGTVQNYPELSQREASTLTRVRDGESFVIGGLLQQNEISSLGKIPGAGNLPVIGGLFRVRHDSSQNTNLYIIVTPRILTNGSNTPPASMGRYYK